MDEQQKQIASKIVLILPTGMEVGYEEELVEVPFITVDSIVRPSFIYSGGVIDMRVLATFNALMRRVFCKMPVSDDPSFYRYARLEDVNDDRYITPSPLGGATFFIVWHRESNMLEFSLAYCHSQVRFSFKDGRYEAKQNWIQGKRYLVDNCDLHCNSSLDIILAAVEKRLGCQPSNESPARLRSEPQDVTIPELKKMMRFLRKRVIKIA